MEYIRQTVSSSDLNHIFMNLPPSLRDRQVEVIILPAENNIKEKPQQKRPVGFARGAEVPDSFFEPLSEEDLQAWGL